MNQPAAMIHNLTEHPTKHTCAPKCTHSHLVSRALVSRSVHPVGSQAPVVPKFSFHLTQCRTSTPVKNIQIYMPSEWKLVIFIPFVCVTNLSRVSERTMWFGRMTAEVSGSQTSHSRVKSARTCT